MSRYLGFAIVLGVAIVSGAALAQTGAAPASPTGDFTITSRDFRPGGTLNEAQVYKGFGCAGGNVSPQLSWQNAPAGTKSFAVTAYDPDAPTGSGWWHWLIFNIPASVTQLPAGAGDPAKKLAPAGSVQGRTDFGNSGFGGACPPKGDKPHRYIFTVFALKTERVEVPPTASAAMIGFSLNAQTLARATVTAQYSR